MSPCLSRCRELRLSWALTLILCSLDCKHADQGVPHPSASDSGGVPHRPAVHDPGRQVLSLSHSQTVSLMATVLGSVLE